MATKDSVQAFNETVKPFFEHKNAYTAEKGFTGERTEEGLPHTEKITGFYNLNQTKNLEKWNCKMQKIIVKEETV